MSAIEGYENYTINESGVVINTNTNHILKIWIDKDGYKRVRLSKKGIPPKNIPVHRLLGNIFIDNPNNYKTIDHINRDKLDNRIENLRWANLSQQDRNRKTYSSLGFHYLVKTQYGFRFQVNRPEIKKSYTNKDLQNVIEYRNKFCAENDIEINDS